MLIFIGGVFLLQNTGYLPPNAWQNMWRLWPVILVLAGIELLLAHRVAWLILAVVAALVLIGGGFATSLYRDTSTAGAVTRSTTTDLGGATQAAVTVRFGAGQLNIGPLANPTPDQLAVMNYTGPTELAVEPRYVPTAGGTGRLDYQTSSRSGPGPGNIPFIGSQSDSQMDINLSPNVPIASLNVQTGATNARLDLANLNVNSIDISLGAATAWIRLPQAAGPTSAHISGGAATITLEVPDGVAAQIHHTGGLSTFDINQNRFPLVSDGVYRSPDYATARNTVDLTIETGFTSIVVN